jgi:hypothetical protein
MERALIWRPFGGLDFCAIVGTIRYSVVYMHAERFDAFRSENGDRKFYGSFGSFAAARVHIEIVEADRQRAIKQRLSCVYD